MAFTPVYRPSGPTIGLSVTGSAHVAVQITASDQTQPNYALFVNPSTTLTVYVALGSTSGNVASASIPGDGTAGSFALGPTQQIVIPAPYIAGIFWVTAIASGAGPTLLTVTPVIVM
jgi:hypothetical protein